MKLYVRVLALVAVGCAHVDLGNIRRRDITIPMRFGEHIERVSRIVGGQEAEANSIPHKVAILLSTPQGTFFCGGSIISASYVLTAAHCIVGSSQIQVIAGAHRPLQSEPTQQFRISWSSTIHPGWNSATLLNDIALIYIGDPFELNEYVQPIGLPTRSQVGDSFAGQQAIVSGWGFESDSATQISEVLRWAQVEILTNQMCNVFIPGLIQGSHICTMGSEAQGPCSGDSGASLVPVGTNVTVGIFSFGMSAACEMGLPAVYTRITPYLDWIQFNTGIIIS